jgi:hypothetical protein
VLAVWDAELEGAMRSEIAELDRQAVEAQARALAIVVTNGKGAATEP